MEIRLVFITQLQEPDRIDAERRWLVEDLVRLPTRLKVRDGDNELCPELDLERAGQVCMAWYERLRVAVIELDLVRFAIESISCEDQALRSGIVSRSTLCQLASQISRVWRYDSSTGPRVLWFTIAVMYSK